MAGARVACLGPQGSFSSRAASELVSGARLVLTDGFLQAFELLLAGNVDYAVIPVENSIQGGVLKNLDLLANTAGVLAIKKRALPIDHRLVTRGKVDFSEIERVYSHEQALAQCSRFLDEKIPNAQRVCTLSTAESLKLLDGHSAGIVGSHIQGEGLVLSKENIANERDNFTEFLLLARRGALPKASEKIFFCASLIGGAGVLFRFLEIFARRNISLTRIESRPIPEKIGCYRFFIECEGDIGRADVRAALDEAERASAEFKLLGAY